MAIPLYGTVILSGLESVLLGRFAVTVTQLESYRKIVVKTRLMYKAIFSTLTRSSGGSSWVSSSWRPMVIEGEGRLDTIIISEWGKVVLIRPFAAVQNRGGDGPSEFPSSMINNGMTRPSSYDCRNSKSVVIAVYIGDIWEMAEAVMQFPVGESYTSARCYSLNRPYPTWRAFLENIVLCSSTYGVDRRYPSSEKVTEVEASRWNCVHVIIISLVSLIKRPEYRAYWLERLSDSHHQPHQLSNYLFPRYSAIENNFLLHPVSRQAWPAVLDEDRTVAKFNEKLIIIMALSYLESDISANIFHFVIDYREHIMEMNRC